FYFYPEVDPVLGPEMRSPGEVLGLADSFGLAFFKAQDAVQGRLPLEGTVLLTVADQDKRAAVDVARTFSGMGFTLKATSGTHAFLAENGIESERVYKMLERRPHIGDAITDGEIQLVINTPRGKGSRADDAYIRQAAVRNKIPYITTITAAKAAAEGIRERRKGDTEVKSLQSYHADIR
ncbi:MAG: carbamoyl phosphate synthase large subunit, partial [Deltaproteobacteria bacterium]|nr:carbamoyl phosphate synthase large subunit [Deltaproteobacteria bacterium]